MKDIDFDIFMSFFSRFCSFLPQIPVMFSLSQGTNFRFYKSGYLYFYSDKEEDYEYASEKSRAIHFIRYITQLTNNIAILADEQDEKILASENTFQTENEITREKTFTVKKFKFQEEKVAIDDYATLKLKSSQHKFYGSSAGLLLIKSEPKKSQLHRVNKKKLCQVSNFHNNMFRLSQIHAPAEICYNFKQKYVAKFHPKIQKQLDNDSVRYKASVQSATENNDSFTAKLDLFIVFSILKEAFPYEFAVLDSYYRIHEKDFVPGTESWVELKRPTELDKLNNSALNPHEKERLIQSLNLLISPDFSVAELVFKVKLGKSKEEKISLKSLIAKARKEKHLNENTDEKPETEIVQFLNSSTSFILNNRSSPD